MAFTKLEPTGVNTSATFTFASANVTGNLTVNNTSNLGPIGNVKISGGSSGQVLSTDGSGSLSWVDQTGGGGGTNYGNANVAAYLPTYTGNFTAGNANVTGNVTASFIIGNGSQLTGLPASYANANVAAYLPTYTGNVSAAYFIGNGATLTNIAGGNVTGQVASSLIAGTVTANAQPNITSVGILSSLSASGNIASDSYFVGNGFYLTGISSGGGGGSTTSISNGTSNVSIPTSGGNVNTSVNGNTNVFVVTGVGANISGNLSITGSMTTGGGTGGTFSGANLISANFFSGDGSLLTGISAATVSANAQPNITSVGALASLTVTGLTTATGGVKTANILDASGTITLQTKYNSVSGDIGVVGNIVAGTGGTGNVTATYFIGNGSQLTGLPATYSNTNVASYLPTYTGNFSAGNISSTGNITAGNVTATADVSGAYLRSTNSQGDEGGEILLYKPQTNSSIAGTGVTIDLYQNKLRIFEQGGTARGGFFDITALGAGVSTDLLAGGSSGYANSNVAAYLPTYTGNFTAGNANVSGNVTATYFIGNGSQLTGLPATYSNVNVAAYLPTYTGNFTAGNANVTGTFTAGNANVIGNVTATYFIGDGSQLTGISSGSTSSISNGTSNVSIPASGGNVNTSVGGNANVFVVTGTGANVNGNLSITGALSTGGGGGGTISGANLISANFFSGDGSLLTGIQANYSNTNVGAYLTTYTGNLSANIINVATITSDTVTANYVAATALVSTNAATLRNTVSTGELKIGVDYIIENFTNAVPCQINFQKELFQIREMNYITFSGITAPVEMNDTFYYFAGKTDKLYLYTDSSRTTAIDPSSWAPFVKENETSYTVSIAGSTNSGNLTVGGSLTVAAGNVTGANIVSANYISGNGGFLTSITGANVTGTVANATYAVSAGSTGTVTTAAQPNITSVGSLASVTITGLTTATGGVKTANIIDTSGTITAQTKYNGVSGDIGVVGNIVAGTGGSGNVTATYFIGNGSQLTGLPSSASLANGTSNVNIASTNGNVTVSVAGSSNVAVFSNTGGNITGNLSVSGVLYAGSGTGGGISGANSITSNYFFGNNLTVTGPTVLQQSQEAFQAKTGATGSVTHDFSTGGTFWHTSVSGNFTAAVTNLPTTAGRVSILSLIIVQGATPYICNAITINGGSSLTIKWPGGTAPTGTASKTEAMVFSIFNNSGTYTVLGQLSSYG